MKKFSLQLWLTSALFVLPLVTLAQTQDPCEYIPGGCDKGRANYIFTTGMAETAQGFLAVLGGACILFIVIGGAQMILSAGDESKAEKGKQSVIWAMVGLGVAMAAQTLVNFVYVRTLPIVNRYNDATVALGEASVSTLLTLFNVAFVIMTIWAGYRMIIGRGKEDEFNKAKTQIIWLIAGAIIINVAHALGRAVLFVGL